jgi:CBS domain-containing protein
MADKVFTISKIHTGYRAFTEMAKRALECVVVADKNRPVQTAPWNATAGEVAEIMKTRDIRRVVLVDDAGEILRLINQSDLAGSVETRYVALLKNIIRKQNLEIEK